jgi:hypothetical protein
MNGAEQKQSQEEQARGARALLDTKMNVQGSLGVFGCIHAKYLDS